MDMVDRERLEAETGLIVLAMGKYGAYELNYSSDIDLIVFYDTERFPFARRTIRAAPPSTSCKAWSSCSPRQPSTAMSSASICGCRPDAGATQVAISTEAAEDYYESMGQNWERAAMIKARACAGDQTAAARFLKAIEPFVWRRNLDFAAIEDIHSIKRQIHAHGGHGDDRRRRPQHQARARRHPRDRVLRADAAADSGRAQSGAPAARHARRAGSAVRTRARGAPTSRTISTRSLHVPAPSRTSPADDRRRADAHAAEIAGRSCACRLLRGLCRCRDVQRSAQAAARNRAGALRKAVRARGAAFGREGQSRLHRRRRRSRDDRDAVQSGFQATRAMWRAPSAAGITAASAPRAARGPANS